MLGEGVNNEDDNILWSTQSAPSICVSILNKQY